MDELMTVVVLVSLLLNLVQSFMVFKSVDTDKARQLLDTARASATKTPSDMDDKLVRAADAILEWYQAQEKHQEVS